LELTCQDKSGATWISYNDPAWLAKRHGMGVDAEKATGAMTAMLNAVAKAAAT
jgi:hypothetical protein